METSCPHMISSTTAAPVVNSSGIVEGLTDASSSWTTSAAFSGIVSTSACGALFRSSLESWLDLLTSTTGAIETADGGCAVPTDFSATPTDGDAASRAWGSTSGTQLGGDDKTFFTSLSTSNGNSTASVKGGALFEPDSITSAKSTGGAFVSSSGADSTASSGCGGLGTVLASGSTSNIVSAPSTSSASGCDGALFATISSPSVG